MNAPAVSVLMTVYNGERYLREAVDSILGQSFQDFEFVIVDDASDDSSPSILASYSDPRIITFRQPGRSGLPNALNAGLIRCRGSYIARLDADDIARKDRLQRQVEQMERHPEACLAGSDYELIDEKGVLQGIRKMGHYGAGIRAALRFGNVLGHSTVIYRKASIQAIGGYDGTLAWGEDYDLYLRLMDCGAVLGIDEPLVKYRVHASNLTATIVSSEKDRSLFAFMASDMEKTLGRNVPPELMATVSEHHRTICRNPETYAEVCRLIADIFMADASASWLSRSDISTMLDATLRELRVLGSLHPDFVRTTMRTELRLIARFRPWELASPRCLRMAYATAFKNGSP
jgi:glycosyltransferase involved in cell wall biosynthesis